MNLRKIISVLTATVITAGILGVIPSAAASFQGGSGTAADPYLVATAEQVVAMRDNLSAHYKLNATIDMSPLGDIKPIGTIAKPFKGSFVCDLNTEGYPLYAIKNLSIHTAETPYIGEGQSKWEAALFGATDSAQITNIYVLDVKIGNNNFGDHRGAVQYGDYKPGMDEQPTAALVGRATNSTIRGCASTGTVSARSNAVSGLIAESYGSTITNCYSLCNVSTEGKWNVGGFIGYAEDNSTINGCFSEGSVSGATFTNGGFIASVNQSVVTNCYSNVPADMAFIGKSENASISNCYGNGGTGGIKGSEAGDTAVNCFTIGGTAGFGFNAGSAADVKAAFSSLSDWDCSGDMPVLAAVKKCPTLSNYAVGAMNGTPSSVQPAVTPSQSQSGAQSSTDASGQEQQAPTGASEEEMKEFSEIIEKLPVSDLITLDNKADMKKAKAIYDKMTDSQQEELDPNALVKYNQCYKALEMLMVADISDRIDKLPSPDKLTEKDFDTVKEIKEDYDFLEDDMKAYISAELTEKLEKCLEIVESGATAVAASSAFTAKEIIVMCILAFVILLNVAANVLLAVLYLKKNKETEGVTNEKADEL